MDGTREPRAHRGLRRQLQRLDDATRRTHGEAGGPDNANSAGALFLTSVADATWEEIESNGIPINDEAVHEIADNAPDAYTHQRFLEFVDLGAYKEDIEDLAAGKDMEAAAGVALYQIAERLAYAIANRYAAEETEDDE